MALPLSSSRCGAYRMAEGIALRIFADELIEFDRVRFRFRAFGDDLGFCAVAISALMFCTTICAVGCK
jgi:hypothetical protein